MSYTTQDFAESLSRVGIIPMSIRSVVAAWGHGTGMGTDAGHPRWSENGVSDWEGGFLFILQNQQYAYLTGWCDYTGWGCQDGVTLYTFKEEPKIADLPNGGYHENPSPEEWDIDPIDLNQWKIHALDEF